MKYLLFLVLSTLVVTLSSNTTGSKQSQTKWQWEKMNLLPGGRFDAIAHFGNGVVLVGSRMPNPGLIFRSTDYGRTWNRINSSLPTDDFITCIASDEKGTGYILTGKHVHVWKSTDSGLTWQDLGQVSQGKNTEGFANAYSILVTDNGTILVADANSSGGNIVRSTNAGQSWEIIPKVSEKALYRLNKTGDGIIANGWQGHIYKSVNDGQTWQDMGKVADSYLYAIEYLDNNIVLIGTESGQIFRSIDNAKTWDNMGVQLDAADDFAFFGNKRVIYTTYKNQKKIYLSEDNGKSWESIGSTNTEEEDWLDHLIAIYNDSINVVVGATNKGFILRYETHP